uniref:26S proteasome non-ATPase regulatory subunit 2 n=1 Tax=Aceria tosichella TaxID=561515 RepID=A0A6G1SC44_9ACAR
MAPHDDDNQIQHAEINALVESIKQDNELLVVPALEQLRNVIRESTTSMTSIPKPLKYLRSKYNDLKAVHETLKSEKIKRDLADIISILAMTITETTARAQEAKAAGEEAAAVVADADASADDAEKGAKTNGTATAGVKEVCAKNGTTGTTSAPKSLDTDVGADVPMITSPIPDPASPAQPGETVPAEDEPIKLSPDESLTYLLMGNQSDIGCWGHEYVRHIAGQIAQKWQSEDCDQAKLLKLVHQIVPYNMKHNSESEAVDLLMEIEKLSLLEHYLDNEDACSRVCLYLICCVPFVADPDNIMALNTAIRIFLKFKKYSEALPVAVQLGDMDLIESILTTCPDRAVQKQMALQLGRQQIFIQNADQDLRDLMSNTHLNENFLRLARELDIMEPKTPDDIYKTHLETINRSSYSSSSNVDSARGNLASSFVNGFVNAGFGKDKLLTGDNGTNWLHRQRDHCMLSATASLGLLMLWDVDSGLAAIDKYLYAGEENIKAGALLACGIVSCGVKNECDPAFALLHDHIDSKSIPSRIGAIVGLGLAYAGSNRADIINVLTPVLHDPSSTSELRGLAALSCGLIAVGSANGDVTSNVAQVLIEKADLKVSDPFARFLPLALGLCYLGKQEEADAIQATLEVIENKAFRAMSMTLVDICAYVATGNVLKIQQLLHICSENIDASKEGTNNAQTNGTTTTPTTKTESSEATTNGTAATNQPSTSSSTSPTTKANQAETGVRQAIATIGIGLIALAEDISCEMAFRTFGHLLRYGESMIKRAVPLALALISVSNAKINILETLSKFSHDADTEVACNAIFAMGIIGAGTNNARLAKLLRDLAVFHYKDANCLFMVRIAQGLTHLGKGTLTMSPFNSDRHVMFPTGIAGLLAVLLSFLDVKQTILQKSHYLLYYLTPAIQPRMLVTFDEELNPLPVDVRVGQAVDVVGQAGKPKSITGFQTHTTPVLLGPGERAELATDEYIPLTPLIEGFVILRKNPNATDVASS